MYFKDLFLKFKDFSKNFKIFTKIQGLFKDFEDRHEIQGFQGFFQGCGNPDIGMTIAGNVQMF